MTLTRDEIEAIITDHVTVTDEWGGEKVANWQYGYNLCVAGIDEATDAIMVRLEQEQKAKDYNPEAILKILGITR